MMSYPQRIKVFSKVLGRYEYADLVLQEVAYAHYRGLETGTDYIVRYEDALRKAVSS
jgi:hypothetical protein